jgi:hypothetical protein
MTDIAGVRTIGTIASIVEAIRSIDIAKAAPVTTVAKATLIYQGR